MTTKTQAQQIADMATTIRCTTGAVDFIAGGRDNVERVAEEWVDAGFDCDDATEWWQAGCFDAASAEILRDAGITPEQAGETEDGETETWGYRHSNNDVTTDDVCEHFGVVADVEIRLWVSNQDLIGADCDYTDSHLDAAKWDSGSEIEMPADRDNLIAWFRDVFLPLQSRVAEAGWGNDEINKSTPFPCLVAYHDAGENYTSAGESLQQVYAAEGNAEKWADSILS